MTSRAGRTGRGWYGSYEIRYQDAAGALITYWTTNRRYAERAIRRLVAEGAAWAELRAEGVPAPLMSRAKLIEADLKRYDDDGK